MALFRRRQRHGEAARGVVDLRVPTELGRPGSCPACGGHGYLDRIDLVHGVQHQHCTACGHAWRLAIDGEQAGRRR